MTIYQWQGPIGLSANSGAGFATADAMWRGWGTLFSAGLTAVGIAKTSDTGQINWTTTTAPTATGQNLGYEIRKLGDNTTNANPIVFKIEFMSNSSNVLSQMRIQVGNGSDGAGNLTGNLSPQFLLVQQTDGSGRSSTTNFISSDGTYLTFVLSINNVNTSVSVQALSLGRTKNSAGANTSDGLNIVFAGNNTTPYRGQYYLPKFGGGAYYNASDNAGRAMIHCGAPCLGTGSLGGNLGVFPVFVPRGMADNPCLGVIVGFTADFGGDVPCAGQTVTVPLYGSNHTYMLIGSFGGGTSSYINSNSNNPVFGMRYE